MRANILLILLLINISFLFAQKEAANWYFGFHAGLNFNDKVPVAQNGALFTLEGCATISNNRGNLLFYTDGTSIWNKRHKIMPNGTGLFGHNSSTQSAIIVPRPGMKNRYYVFTVDHAEITKASELKQKQGLNFSEVDMNLNNGQGDIIPEVKNKHLVTYNPNNADQARWRCSEKIAAIIHDDEDSYWVVTHFIDTFYAFQIDENGVSEDPVKSKVNEVVNIVELNDGQGQRANISALGYLKISPDGKKIAIVHSSTAATRTSGKVYLYDFDSSTGKISNNGNQLLEGTYPYGIEFSPKSKKLYVTTNNYITRKGEYKFESSSLYQFDLQESNIRASKTEIHLSGSELAGALQLAINGKIYRAKYDQTRQEGGRHLGAINKPELVGKLSNYENNAVELKAGTSSNYGLPPFTANAFRFTFDYEFTCLGDQTHFFLTSDEEFDSIIWKFEDGTIYEKLTDFYHEFLTPGPHIVILETTTNSIPNKPVKKTIDIIDIVEVITTPYELIQCDTDANTEDGIARFNLQLANDPISLGKGDEVDVYYYKDETILHDDVENTNALSEFYNNTVPNELLYAKVLKENSYCYSVAKVILNARKTTNIAVSRSIGCNLGDGTAQFDLASQKAIIINENTDLGTNTTISFHTTAENARLGYNPLNENYTSRAKSVFFRIENENICYGTGELVLEIDVLPNINLEEKLDICRSSFPIKINAGVATDERMNYSYYWESGETSYEIEIRNEGEFNVLITNNVSACSLLRRIRVNNIKEPEIMEVEIEDNLDSYTATIRTNDGSALLYSLNNDFGIHRNDPVFTGLAPGVYTAYVSDPMNCYTVEKQFYIFGFPKFFTPNNDGYNDYWEVKGIDKSVYTYSDILVFDRFGKFLVKFKADANWNGTYNGKNLPPDDYWYKVTVTDQKNNSTSHSGHFSIVR